MSLYHYHKSTLTNAENICPTLITAQSHSDEAFTLGVYRLDVYPLFTSQTIIVIRIKTL